MTEKSLWRRRNANTKERKNKSGGDSASKEGNKGFEVWRMIIFARRTEQETGLDANDTQH